MNDLLVLAQISASDIPWAAIGIGITNVIGLAILYGRFVVMENIVKAWMNPDCAPPGFCARAQRHCANWDGRENTQVHPPRESYSGTRMPGGA